MSVGSMSRPSIPCRWGSILLMALCLAASGCRKDGEVLPLGLELNELRNNAETGYFDAVVRVSKIDVGGAWLDRFDVVTPTSFFPLADLVFLEAGDGADSLETGDIFVVPLGRPDWRLSLFEGPDLFGSLVFWDNLPESDQWHPLKSEAMRVAASIGIDWEEGYKKPIPGLLPREWIKTGEKLPDPDDPVGEIVYRKVRGEIVREELYILYTSLTEEEKAEAETLGSVNFLRSAVDWAARQGQEAELEGRPVVVWDDEGNGLFGWAYRYMYIDGDLLVEVRLDSDPLEWVKTDREKALEARTDRIFLRYGFWPVGQEQGNVLIEIRMDRTGRFMKRSEATDSVEVSFQLDDREFREIETLLEENRFDELESRSGPPGGMSSFISVLKDGTSHTVEIRNFRLDPYRMIESKIRDIVLPKVGETFEF